MLIDTHCHLNLLDLSNYDNNLENVLSHAKSLDVNAIINIALTEKDAAPFVAQAAKYPNIYTTIGLHPTENPEQPLDLASLEQFASNEKVVAIGETGLDYYHIEPRQDWQVERFCQQIELAKGVNKPLIIHTRDSSEDTIDILKQNNASAVGGVMHCFVEDWETAVKCLDLGFYISFSGIVTFKNAKSLQEVAMKLPLDRMLVETDAPFLAPTPYRGKPNYPGYTRHTAEFIASLRNQPYEDIARATTSNACELFGISV